LSVKKFLSDSSNAARFACVLGTAVEPSGKPALAHEELNRSPKLPTSTRRAEPMNALPFESATVRAVPRSVLASKTFL
jgi:hypothetical protein